MRTYTRTGDGGTTGLIGGQRVPKNSLRIHAIGEIDELNATVGLTRSIATSKSLDPTLNAIQNWLFCLGSELADPSGCTRMLSGAEVALLEREIDQFESSLPPLRQFILPGGDALAASLHQARTVCRRAERSLHLLDESEEVGDEAKRLLNRLSDWLFVAARLANNELGIADIVWQPMETR